MKISFIMSVYNIRKEWISRAVDSVKNQTLNKWELLIIDDGSKKETADYLDEIAEMDSRIRVFHQSNQGVSVARNIGIDNASGEYVAFLDSDDWLEKTYVEEVLKVLGENRTLELLTIGHDDVYDKKQIEHLWGKELLHFFEFSEREGMQMALLQLPEGLRTYPMFFGAPWKVICSLEFLNKFGIRNIPGLKKAQDSVFNLYAVEYATKIGYYNRVLYHYFHNDDSVTGKGFNRDLERFQKLLLAYKAFLEEMDKYTNLKYREAYKKNALVQFETMLNKYFTNKENTDSINERKKLMGNILSASPYKELLTEENGDGLSLYRRILFYLMKRMKYKQICMLYILKQKIKCKSKY